MKEKMIKCPRCQKPSLYALTNESRPFCSPLCKMEDIGAWAFEEYKIPGPYADPEDLLETTEDDEDLEN